MQSDTVDNLHVLLVERDELVRELFTMLLVGKGFIVDTASNAAAALEIVEKKIPDVIFSALMLQDIDGFELCRQFRKNPELEDKLIVALTGYSSRGIREKVKAAGFDEYFLKPVNIDVLLSLLELVRSKRQATQTLPEVSL